MECKKRTSISFLTKKAHHFSSKQEHRFYVPRLLQTLSIVENQFIMLTTSNLTLT